MMLKYSNIGKCNLAYTCHVLMSAVIKFSPSHLRQSLACIRTVGVCLSRKFVPDMIPLKSFSQKVAPMPCCDGNRNFVKIAINNWLCLIVSCV